MSQIGFFSEARDQSIVKRDIVTKYFKSWAQIIKNRARKINYIDLYCGQGIYNDGTESTPILITKHCLSDTVLKDKIHMILNDCNQTHLDILRKSLSTIDNIKHLEERISISQTKLTTENASSFFDYPKYPCFSFIDPCGYAGVTKGLLKNLLSDWGSDCIMFFNYNEIKRFVTATNQKDNMIALFGEFIYQELVADLSKKVTPAKREKIILNKFIKSLSEFAKYILPFRFQKEQKNETSHYLIFLTKNITGYKIMKDIMAKEGNKTAEGIPLFEFLPLNETGNGQYNFVLNIDELKQSLLHTFHKRKLPVFKIILEHIYNTPYITNNYKEALIQLEVEKKIIVIPYNKNRKPGTTMSEKNIIDFI